jgi:hypothetical protein
VASHVSTLGSYFPAELQFPIRDQDAFVEKLLSAPSDPFSELADSFGARFSREAFDARAQEVSL